jgi:hypothetical protein
VRLDKVKHPAGVFSFELHALDEDSHGVWLLAPVGSPWVAPQDAGALSFDVVALIKPGRWFATWWVDDPHDRRVEIDISLPPDRTEDGWSCVDLELDVFRHEPDFVEVRDRDEFDVACRNQWITPQDAAMAEATAAEMQRVLEQRVEPWGDQGWRRLTDAIRRRRGG